MKTLITARFDKNYTDMLETITTDYEFAGYGVTGIKMPVPEMKEKIKDVELLISEFEDITKVVIIVCCRNEAFASIDIEAATAKGIPVLRAGGRNAIAVAEHTIALLMCVSKNMSLTDHLLKYTDQLTNVQYHDNGGKRAETIADFVRAAVRRRRFDGRHARYPARIRCARRTDRRDDAGTRRRRRGAQPGAGRGAGRICDVP